MIKIAQIGCGYWGPNILRNLVVNSNCCVKTVVDSSADRREFVRKLYPAIKTTDNMEAILNDDSIKAVVISTPACTHFDIALKCLLSGKHCLVEKPLAMTVKEIDSLDEVAKKHNLVLMAGHTFLYNSAVIYLKKLVDNGDLGEIRYIHSERLNLGRIRSDIDALWNFAPHDVSIIQFLLNGLHPISVCIHGMDYIQNNIHDVVFMNIKYPNKLMANIHVSWLAPKRVRCLTVVGSKKMAVYDDIAEDKIAIYDKGIDRKAVLGEHMDFDNDAILKFNYRDGDLLFPKVDFQEPLKQEISHFVDCILNGTKCITDSAHARQVTAILSGDCL
ncbi:MAG: oxidoreductase protein [uncultured bacterium]|nr:MAG: oxidoreductase protein [uncultured bacterium]